MLKSAPLDNIAGVRHAFFTRQGGVSDGIYASLNCGAGSSDDPNHIVEKSAVRQPISNSRKTGW